MLLVGSQPQVPARGRRRTTFAMWSIVSWSSEGRQPLVFLPLVVFNCQWQVALERPAETCAEPIPPWCRKLLFLLSVREPSSVQSETVSLSCTCPLIRLSVGEPVLLSA